MMKRFLAYWLMMCMPLSMLHTQTVRIVPGAYATINAAIAAASPGDIISIGAGTYNEQLRIQKNLTFIGAGQDQTLIHDAAGSPDSTAMFIDNCSVTVRDIQFLGGSANPGGFRGLVAVNSTTVIRQCAFVAFVNAAISDVNGSIDIDTVVVTCVNNVGPVVVDSAAPGQFVLGGFDLGVLLVNSYFSIKHFTGGARIDHVINLQPDLSLNPTFLGQEYAVDPAHNSTGTIENSTFFGSREGYYGQGIRIFGSLTRQPINLVIRNNRFKGTVTDSTLAMPDMPTTAGISFNGYNGYAEIYNNMITQFNSGIAFHGIASANMHDNTITGNARYGVVTTDGVYAVTPPDLGGGAFGSPGGNTICNNGHYNVYNRNAAVHWATGNDWGTTDPAAIDASIYDDNEGASGIVHFENYSLPVELSSFTTASVSGDAAVLHWKTATEVNDAGFEVERKRIDGTEGGQAWTGIGFVAGAGTSNAPHEYYFTDGHLAAGHYAYRLRETDRDGKFAYSASIDAWIGHTPSVFGLSQNYPNPFNPSTTMSFTVAVDGRASLKVYNMLGQVVATVFDGVVQTGSVHTVTIDGSALASGVYYACLESNSLHLMKKITLLK
jgi:hypothetical protein